MQYTLLIKVFIDSIEKVQNFLAGTFQLPNDSDEPGINTKPWLFCSDDWTVAAEDGWATQALDNKGNPIFKKDVEGNPTDVIQPIADVPEYQNEKANPENVPYVSANLPVFFKVCKICVFDVFG